MFTKIRNNLFIIVLIGFIVGVSLPSNAQQRYSIDHERKIKKARKPFFLKRWFMPGAERAIRKQERKDKRKKERLRKQYLREVKRTPKRLNNVKEAGTNRKVYKRMKRERKKSKKLRQRKR